MKNTETEALTEEVCPNCGSALHGNFCFSCGQNQRDLNRFFWSLIRETFEDIFSFNSRVSLTLSHLFFKPGFISEEYSRGRRARYLPPLRLYIITSVLFVLFLSLQNILNPDHQSDFPIVISSEDSANNSIHSADDKREMTDEEAVAEIESTVDQLDLSWLPEKKKAEFRVIAQQQADKAFQIYKEDPTRFSEIILDTLPPLMFILLPIFALLLKLTYFFSARYYTEHLVFALHNHSFLYLAAMLMQLLGLISAPSYLVASIDWILTILGLWIPIYLILSVKVFYKQGLVSTLVKSMFLSISYSILLLVTFILAMIWGFFTL